jgi:hypothetical protein
MINEEKVILMTKLQMYEDEHGKKTFSILKFFRSDYISLQLLKGFVAVTICFGMVMGLWMLSHMEDILSSLNTMDYGAIVMLVVGRYGVVLLIYLLLVYIYSAMTYTKARREGRRYHKNLKTLKKLNEPRKERS